MKSSKSLIKNYIYSLSYQILIMIVPIVVTPYISRVLGAKQIGHYSYSMSIVSYFNLIANLGISTYAQIGIARIRDSKNKVSKFISEVLFCKLVCGGISAILYIIYSILIKDLIAVELVLIPLSSILDISWLYQGIEDFKKITIRNFIVKLSSVILIFIFVKKESDLFIYTLIMSVSLVIGNMCLWINIKKYLFNKISRNLFITHLRNSITYFIPTISVTIYTILDKSMIGWFTKTSVENGLYEQAHKLEQVIVTILTSMSVVLLPRMVYLSNKKNNDDIKKIINKCVEVVCFIGMPLTVGTFAIADVFIPVFLGTEFHKCIILLRIFSPLIFVVGLNNLIGMQCLMSRGKQKEYNVSVMVGAIIDFGLNIILIPKWYSVGAAISSVLAEFIILVLFCYFGREVIDFVNMFKTLCIYLVVSLIMGIIVYKSQFYFTCNNILKLMLMIFVGGIIYILLAGLYYLKKYKKQMS